MTTTTPEGRALAALTKASKAHAAAQDKADATLAARDRMVLEVRETHGITYTHMAAALGLTRDRVTQILRNQRAASAARTTKPIT